MAKRPPSKAQLQALADLERARQQDAAARAGMPPSGPAREPADLVAARAQECQQFGMSEWSLRGLMLEDGALLAHHPRVFAGWMERLRELDLSRNQLADAAAVHLALALRHAPRLRTLRLNDNVIGDEGACAIARELPRCWVERLYLHSNRLGQAAYVSLAVHVAWSNLTLLHMHLNEPMAQPAAAALAAALPLTRLITLQVTGLTNEALAPLDVALAHNQATPRPEPFSVLLDWRWTEVEHAARCYTTAQRSAIACLLVLARCTSLAHRVHGLNRVPQLVLYQIFTYLLLVR